LLSAPHPPLGNLFPVGYAFGDKGNVGVPKNHAVALPKIIWDKIRNPTRHASDALGIERWQIRVAIHKIKAANNLGPTDKVIIFDDGKVTDTNGVEIGNIFDEI
jgi:hypothetical protein